MVSPPRDRPIASRPDFLSFANAPRTVISGRDAAGSGRVLMGAGDRGISAHRPLLILGLVAPGPQPVQELLPGPVQRPAAMPVVHGLPISSRSSPAGPATGSQPGHGRRPVDHGPVISPPAAARLIHGQEHPQVLPFLTRQVMAIQAIKHPTDLHDAPIKIHGTRPRRGGRPASSGSRALGGLRRPGQHGHGGSPAGARHELRSHVFSVRSDALLAKPGRRTAQTAVITHRVHRSGRHQRCSPHKLKLLVRRPWRSLPQWSRPSGLHICSIFAPCLLGCPGTGGYKPSVDGRRLGGIADISAAC